MFCDLFATRLNLLTLPPSNSAQGSQWFQVRAPFVCRIPFRIIAPPHARSRPPPTALFLSQRKSNAANLFTSRQSLKKYVRANNNITVSDNMFDSLFNKALKAGVDKGVFEQPKGMHLAVSDLALILLLTFHRPLRRYQARQEDR
jgi:hypothetical protein